MAIDTRTEAEKRYDAERNGELYVKPADDDRAEPEDYAAWDAESQQKVYDLIKQDLNAPGEVSSLFCDTIPGHIGDAPIDLLVAFGIGAAIETNQAALGITRNQVFAIMEHITKVCDEYLVTPARRVQLMWQGE